MSSTTLDDVKELLSWSASHGSRLHSSVEVYLDDISGLSFRATNPVAANTQLVACSYQTSLSWLNVVSGNHSQFYVTNDFPTTFIEAFSADEPNVLSHFLLMQQYLLKDKSFWWPYLKTLPQPHELSIPTLWSSRDQDFFVGTNAEPALQKRKALWRLEWKQARTHLEKQPGEWQNFTFELYQWAAVIFGSRSFRPSLTLSPQEFDPVQDELKRTLIQSHIQNDTFSILFPVLDIGNHNGKNSVQWGHENGQFRLSTDIWTSLTLGEQIYNFYGDKSNSELLVAYGFMLPGEAHDRVNIKLHNLPEDVQNFRRTQPNHVQPNPNRPEEEFMYYVGRRRGASSAAPLSSLSLLSTGLFDTVIYLVANARERALLQSTNDYSSESNPSIFESTLARSAHIAIQIIKDKVQSELTRLIRTDPGPPENSNQGLAIAYRKKTQLLLERCLSQMGESPQPHLLKLPWAYAWLSGTLPDIYHKVKAFICEDQEESTPLDWSALVDDWDHTYLMIWLYIVISQYEKDAADFETHDTIFCNLWLRQVIENAESDQFYAEAGEVETIESTATFVAGLFGHDADQMRRLVNMASYILKTESVRGLIRVSSDGHDDTQEMLCLPISLEAPSKIE